MRSFHSGGVLVHRINAFVGANMLLVVALGETVYWAHRCRRLIILSSLTAMIVSVGLFAAHHVHLAQHFTTPS
jgi:hypothetical protein